MSKLELLWALYEYNEWANEHLLEAVSALAPDEFSKPGGASFGSIEANLAHIAAAQIVWLSRWAQGVNPRLLQDQAMTGLEAIRGAFAESHRGLRAFLDSLAEERLDGILAYQDSRGNRHERVLWQLMAHVVNHGTHHRAETAMALAGMGKPMRELDYVFFEIERERSAAD